jgi:cysteinyl-tRNA synthetase
LQAAEKGLERLHKAIDTLAKLKAGKSSDYKVAELINKCYTAMNDDFNSPITIANLFDGVKWINSVNDEKASLTKEDIEKLQKLYTDFVFNILGLKAEQSSESNDGLVDGLMETILEIRKGAKANKDWATADKIRDGLNHLNIAVKDTPDGATWEVKE